ncbi:MAG: histidine kinase [Sulfuritalea sp.]|nr:histidine kinase [Sulfuritalea sp.]
MKPSSDPRGQDANLRAALRAAAEAKLASAPLGEASARPLEEVLHELRVHQIELEMQNEALRQAQIELEASRDGYVDLYDFSPVGYLTLSFDGTIEQINLTGVALLKVERKKLLHKRLATWVIAADRERWFRHFLSVKNGDPQSNGRSATPSWSIELACNGAMARSFRRTDCLRLESRTSSGLGLLAFRMALTDISARHDVQQALRETPRVRIVVAPI